MVSVNRNCCFWLLLIASTSIGGIGFGAFGVYLQNIVHPTFEPFQLQYTGGSWSVVFFILYLNLAEYVLRNRYAKTSLSPIIRIPFAVLGGMAFLAGVWLFRL